MDHKVEVIISDDFNNEKRILMEHSEIIFNPKDVETKLFRMFINCEEYFEEYYSER